MHYMIFLIEEMINVDSNAFILELNVIFILNSKIKFTIQCNCPLWIHFLFHFFKWFYESIKFDFNDISIM